MAKGNVAGTVDGIREQKKKVRAERGNSSTAGTLVNNGLSILVCQL